MTLLTFALFMKHTDITLLSYEDGSCLIAQVAKEDAKVLFAVDMSDGDVSMYWFVKGKRVKRPPQAYPKWLYDVIRYRQALYDVTVQQGFTVEGIAI